MTAAVPSISSTPSQVHATLSQGDAFQAHGSCHLGCRHTRVSSSNSRKGMSDGSRDHGKQYNSILQYTRTAAKTGCRVGANVQRSYNSLPMKYLPTPHSTGYILRW